MIVGDIGGNRTHIKMVLQTIPYTNIGYDAHVAAGDFNPHSKVRLIYQFLTAPLLGRSVFVGFLF